MNFLTNTFGGPKPVLQFVDLNIRIENSFFRNLQGTPYTMIFNNSNVEFVDTVFSGNTGGPPPPPPPFPGACTHLNRSCLLVPCRRRRRNVGGHVAGDLHSVVPVDLRLTLQSSRLMISTV